MKIPNKITQETFAETDNAVNVVKVRSVKAIFEKALA